ncbi:MAG: hypothetical protein QOG10_7213, partial [Kribbellaceae bacterium]|nr:hypothetical protein [Kribbellaceae bacterium]
MYVVFDMPTICHRPVTCGSMRVLIVEDKPSPHRAAPPSPTCTAVSRPPVLPARLARLSCDGRRRSAPAPRPVHRPRSRRSTPQPRPGTGAPLAGDGRRWPGTGAVGCSAARRMLGRRASSNFGSVRTWSVLPTRAEEPLLPAICGWIRVI